MTLDKARLDRKVGKLNSTKIEEVNRYLLAHLDIKMKKNECSRLTDNK